MNKNPIFIILSFIFLSVGLAEVFECFKQTFDDVFTLASFIIDFWAKNLIDMVDIIEYCVVTGLFSLNYLVYLLLLPIFHL